MPYYNFNYSLMVVERFTKARARGWAILQNKLDDFYLEDLVHIFQTSQKKWNVLKKLIKLLDRTGDLPYYTNVKLRELYYYFKEVQERQDLQKDYLTRFRRYLHTSNAPKT